MIKNLQDRIDDDELVSWRYIPLSRKLIEDKFGSSNIIVYGRLLTYQSNGSEYSTYNNTEIYKDCNVQRQHMNRILKKLEDNELIQIKMNGSTRKIYTKDITKERGFIKCYNGIFGISGISNNQIVLYSYLLGVSHLKHNTVIGLKSDVISKGTGITKQSLDNNLKQLEKLKLINLDTHKGKIAVEILVDFSKKQEEIIYEDGDSLDNNDDEINPELVF